MYNYFLGILHQIEMEYRYLWKIVLIFVVTACLRASLEGWVYKMKLTHNSMYLFTDLQIDRYKTESMTTYEWEMENKLHYGQYEKWANASESGILMEW